MKIIITCLMFFILTGCKNEGNNGKATLHYFDLKGFLDKEIKFLNSRKAKLTKRVFLNNKTEFLSITNPDWNKELQAFFDSDINKKSWKDSYKKDTLFYENNKPHKIIYSAKDIKLRTSSLRIEFGRDYKILKIDIRKETSNFLYTTKQILLYIPQKKYSVITVQQVIFSQMQTVNIKGEIQPPFIFNREVVI